MYLIHLLSFVGLVAAAPSPAVYNSSQFDPCSYAAEDVVVRDVVVIGGGASGTYGAIALKDQGRSVAVIEKQPHFGGHVNTYTDPKTGLALDYGVQGYGNDSITRNFFGRFNVSLQPLVASVGEYIKDFSTGQNVTTASKQDPLTQYALNTNKYYPEPALGIHLPTPVPEDLLLPFHEYLTKYNLTDAAYTIWSFTSPANNLLNQLTLYAFVGCNAASTPLLGGRGQDTTTRNNSEVYGKAERELANTGSALLSSTVVATKRSNNSVSMVVQSPAGKKLVMASHVLFSAPIVLKNIETFDLDTRERSIFSQFYYTAWYTALVNNTGLAPGFAYQNADPDTPYNIPLEPYTFRIGPARDNSSFYCFYGAQTDLPQEVVEARIADTLRTLSGKNDTNPQFMAFASHSPFKQQVSKEAVADGFYDKLNALQGYRGTHYTGNALDASGSSSLFNFTKQLLPSINEAIDAKGCAPKLPICSQRA